MTQAELDALKALADAAQGWELAAFSPRAVLALIAEVERLRDELDECRSVYGYAHPLGGPGSDEVRYEHS